MVYGRDGSNYKGIVCVGGVGLVLFHTIMLALSVVAVVLNLRTKDRTRTGKVLLGVNITLALCLSVILLVILTNR